MRAHTAAHDVAMALRSSGIDARTYLCRAPLDRIDVRTPQRRTHSHSSGSRCLNNAHVLYRKCLFVINIPPVRTGLNGSYTLFLLPFYHALLRSVIPGECYALWGERERRAVVSVSNLRCWLSESCCRRSSLSCVVSASNLRLWLML